MGQPVEGRLIDHRAAKRGIERQRGLVFRVRLDLDQLDQVRPCVPKDLADEEAAIASAPMFRGNFQVDQADARRPSSRPNQRMSQKAACASSVWSARDTRRLSDTGSSPKASPCHQCAGGASSSISRWV